MAPHAEEPIASVSTAMEVSKANPPLRLLNAQELLDTNGYYDPSQHGTLSMDTLVARSHTDQEHNSIVQKTLKIVSQRMLTSRDDIDDELWYMHITIEDFLQFLASERLICMPHRGSRWDKVLKCAEYFGLQVTAYGESLAPFASGSVAASRLILASCRSLLDLGHVNAGALDVAFSHFYKLGISLSFLLRNRALFYVNEHIRQDLSEAFTDLLYLVSEVDIHYHKRISHNDVAVLDFYASFGRYIDSFYRQKNHIADAIWSHSLRASSQEVGVEIRYLRKWLGPNDPALKGLVNHRLATKGPRAEYTCEWFQRHLVDFVRGSDEVFMVSGPAGSGKSVLSGWIEERLQRPLGRKSYEAISFTFESDIPSEATTTAFLKNLLLQLLERHVGDANLYNKLKVAYIFATASRDTSKAEQALWDALHTGLKHNIASTGMVLVIDGLDQIIGGETACTGLLQQLGSLTSQLPRIRIVVLSRPLLPTSANPNHRQLTLTEDLTRNDIREVLQSQMVQVPHYSHLESQPKDEIVERLVNSAHGSFLWAVLAVRLLQEAPHESFEKTLEHLPKSLTGMVGHCVEKIDSKSSSTWSVLSWLLIAERPLTELELKELLRVDLDRRSMSDLKPQHGFEDAYKHILIAHNGFVRFRHSYIRQHLHNLAKEGKVLTTPDLAHKDILYRMLGLFKLNYDVACEPSMDMMSWPESETIIRKHSMLGYITRHWTTHFRKRSMYAKTDEFRCSDQLKALFPDTPFLSQIEWSCWEVYYSHSEAVEMHDLALRVRRSVFGENHCTVLQSAIILGSLHRKSGNLIDASEYFYQAAKVGTALSPKFITIVMACTTIYLSCTESVVCHERTDIVNRRIEMLEYIIEASKHHHGATSEVVIKYYNMLATIYTELKEEEHATDIYKELREIIVKKHGKTSTAATDVSGKLMVLLRKDHKHVDLDYTVSIFETNEDSMDLSDLRRINIIIELSETYRSRGKVALAEETLILLWSRITEISRTNSTIEIRLALIDVALAYATFLRHCDRHEEAATVLICVWSQYEHESHESLEMIVRLNTVAHLLRSIGCLHVALSIYQAAWSFFKKLNQLESREAIDVVIFIAETTEEIMKTTIETTVVTTDISFEIILREIFERTLELKGVTIEVIKSCNALVSVYIRKKRWAEAIDIMQKTLSIGWTVVISGEGELTLPSNCGHELIFLALRLAECYRHHHDFVHAEKIYDRVFRACVVSLPAENHYVQASAYALLEIYEFQHRHDKAIEICQVLREVYLTKLATGHDLTIKLLYKLGALCFRYGRKSGHDHYLQIITSLNGETDVCHNDAVEAVIILANWYYEERRWSEAHGMYELLWKTLLAPHQHEKHVTESNIEIIFEQYYKILRLHVKADYTVIRRITDEYRNITIRYFGVSALVTFKALMSYALVCEEREEFYEEAIEVYEKILKRATTTKTTISSTTIATIKERLTMVYLKVVVASSSKETISRAITLCQERHEVLKIALGCWHKETLLFLEQLVVLHKKLNSADSHTTIIDLLRLNVLDIITQDISANRFYEAALVIGSIYHTQGLVEHGAELLRRLQRVVVIKDVTWEEEFQVKARRSVDKVLFAFLVAFEDAIHGSSVRSLAETMADLLTEAICYEHFNTSVNSKVSAETVLIHGSRLRHFLAVRKREMQLKSVDEQLFAIFTKTLGASIKGKKEASFSFYVSITHQLGRERREINIGDAACAVSVAHIKTLLTEGEFQEAYEYAVCAVQFINAHQAMHHLHNIGFGLKLSQYLAGHGVGKSPDKKLQGRMIQLSSEIIQEVLSVCKEANINFIQMKIEDLETLVHLLGDQRNYEQLEVLLSELWSSREVQRTWSQELVINVGVALVQSRFSAGHHDSAIRLCEDICYNLRRTYGSLSKLTLDMYKILSSIYMSNNAHAKAMGIHEEVLRLVIQGDDDDDEDMSGPSKLELAQISKTQLALLKRSYAHLGKWDKSQATYKALYEQLCDEFGADQLGVPAIEKWERKNPDGKGLFVSPQRWSLHELSVGEMNKQARYRNTSAHWGIPCGGSAVKA